MTVWDMFKTKNADELVEWIDEHMDYDYAPWFKWWDENYCNKCDGVFYEGQDWGWCELNHKCKYFQDMNEIPDSKQIIKMWLESEIEYEN